MDNYPQLGRQTQAKIMGSPLAEMNDVGRLPHFEAFDKFIEILLEFLKK